ncbi:AraC family transcriptional regulator [Alkalilimnicola sp. S0819]|uniref:AraC family transcriptional regulator n=1 Tax=Alkalilimnicola sp. S0819 TaxID=2613922 RepID=UPI0012623893|nr:AraC family transcriptional regulator [Alkalilimnicola sp. S0819]KAB7622770.1 AraC family transcriptional regulator [Alkalilimnicola sp. S0819]MPQ17266.1 AraC family transcriptional regulator [Alkalilimnicola sp. S0819]
MQTRTGPSDWPLPPEGVRFLVPTFVRQALAEHPLSRELYPAAIGYYPSAKGHAVARAEHHDDLLLYCAEGEGELCAAGHCHRVRRGDLMLLPRELTHRYSASEADPWTLYWVHFDGPLSPAIWEMLHFDPQRPVLSLGPLTKLVADFEILLEVRQTGYQVPLFVHAANHLRQMLTYLGIVARSARRQASGLDLDEIHALMQENLHGQLDLAQLAARVNLSKYTFSRKYKQLTGRPPIQHFIHLKMERACYLLDVSEKNISQIADVLGYEDLYYFSRLFRKVIGVSPSQYRAMKHG